MPTPTKDDSCHSSIVPTLAIDNSFHSSIVPTLATYDSFHSWIAPTLAEYDSVHSSIVPMLDKNDSFNFSIVPRWEEVLVFVRVFVIVLWDRIQLRSLPPHSGSTFLPCARSAQANSSIYIYMYVHIYMCVCIHKLACAHLRTELWWNQSEVTTIVSGSDPTVLAQMRSQ